MFPEISIPPFKDVNFYTRQGKVLSNQKRSDTIVRGNEHSVSSHVSITTEFWILTKDGKEENLKFAGYDLPVREGHEISVIWGERGKTSEWLFFWNHTADIYYHLDGDMWDKSDRALMVAGFIGMSFFLVALFSLLFVKSNIGVDDLFGVKITLFISFIVSFLAIYQIKKYFKYKTNQTTLKQHIKTYLNLNN